MTDPARTTKGSRHGALNLAVVDDQGMTWINRAWLCDLVHDADAADALRAQVAALQAENEQFFRDTNTQMLVQQSTIRDLESTIKSLEAELAAAQAKLAVPVPSDVRAILDCVRDYDRSNDSAIDQLCDAAESLARDNAALRTKAEALERERDGLRDAGETLRDWIHDHPQCVGHIGRGLYPIP